MSTDQRFSTALRIEARRQIEHLGRADIIVGIPCYQSGKTIRHVLESVFRGLATHYPDARSLILVSDGGSTDDTREIAESVDEKAFDIVKVVAIYRGLPGKGSALRAIFEAAEFLRPRALAVFDSDLISISPRWVSNLLEPVYDGHDFVAPDYERFKLDGTITNTIAYNLTRALYGRRVRQPIGGDFGMSGAMVRHFMRQDAWETDVARFGIDIWMTTTAIVDGFRLCQARLGVKVHGHKDPAADLGPMFRQVVGTIFRLMETHEPFWRSVEGSQEVPVVGTALEGRPHAFTIDRAALIEYFRVGFLNFGGLWRETLEKEDFEVIRALAEVPPGSTFVMPIATWVRIVYRYAIVFHGAPRQRMKLLDTMIPLYHARVASMVEEMNGMGPKRTARFFQEQAQAFESMKPYLMKNWK
jgi:glycosyltransferase involved in cell wall biosynthesis